MELIISVVIGIVLAFLICGGLKAQLKNTDEATQAMPYLIENSVKYSIRKDVFSHTKTTREKKN